MGKIEDTNIEMVHGINLSISSHMIWVCTSNNPSTWMLGFIEKSRANDSVIRPQVKVERLKNGRWHILIFISSFSYPPKWGTSQAHYFSSEPSLDHAIFHAESFIFNKDLIADIHEYFYRMVGVKSDWDTPRQIITEGFTFYQDGSATGNGVPTRFERRHNAIPDKELWLS